MALGVAFVVPTVTLAHVKWFSNFAFTDPPLTWREAVTPTFLLLGLLSVVVLSAFVLLDEKLEKTEWYSKLDAWLATFRDQSSLVLRIGAGAVLLLSWQSDALLVPGLDVAAAWIGWVQFVIALLLLFERTVPIAGAGLLILYGVGVFQFGMFYMLDYLLYVGVGYYFLFSGSYKRELAGSRIPFLYLTVGFSLCWVGLEKIIYPQWGLYVLEQNPELTLGFPIEFFLIAAAFVEMSLGYLLIICLLQRPMALVITLVFFTTTLFFGKLEVIGHTMIHAALIVFMIEGPGKVFKPPYAFHKRLPVRMAFAGVNYAVLVAILIVPYSLLAQRTYEHYTEEHSHALPEAEGALTERDLSVESDSTSRTGDR